MKHFLITAVLSLLPLAAPAPGQERDESSLLETVRRTFDRADSDDDGALDPAEAKRATIPTTDFLKHDHDGDRRLSGDEFVVYYRTLLESAEQPVDASLAREIERIEAARRQRADQERKQDRIEEARDRAGENEADVDARRRVERAKADIESRVARGELSRAEADRELARLEQRAPDAAGPDRDAEIARNVSNQLARAEAALDRLVERGALTPAQAEQKREVLRRRAELVTGRARAVRERRAPVDVRKRLERAQNAVRGEAARGELSRDEAKQRKDVLVDRARNAASDLSPSERQKLGTALERLDAARARGELTETAWRSQRAALIERAQRAGRVGEAPDSGDARARGEAAREQHQDRRAQDRKERAQDARDQREEKLREDREQRAQDARDRREQERKDRARDARERRERERETPRESTGDGDGDERGDARGDGERTGASRGDGGSRRP